MFDNLHGVWGHTQSWRDDMTRKTSTQPIKRLKIQDEVQPAKPTIRRLAATYIDMLRVDDKLVYLKAACSLIEMGDQAVPALIRALGDQDEQVWRLASAALVKIGLPAVNKLVEALEHEDEQIRLLSAAALHKIGRPMQGEPGWNLMWREYRKLLRYQRERGILAFSD
jgi:HEAT repeat protein